MTEEKYAPFAPLFSTDDKLLEEAVSSYIKSYQANKNVYLDKLQQE